MKIALTVHSTTEPTQEVIDFLTSKGDVKYVIRNEAEGNYKEFIIDENGVRYDLTANSPSSKTEIADFNPDNEYNKGDLVYFDGAIYRSEIDGNSDKIILDTSWTELIMPESARIVNYYAEISEGNTIYKLREPIYANDTVIAIPEDEQVNNIVFFYPSISNDVAADEPLPPGVAQCFYRFEENIVSDYDYCELVLNTSSGTEIATKFRFTIINDVYKYFILDSCPATSNFYKQISENWKLISEVSKDTYITNKEIKIGQFTDDLGDMHDLYRVVFEKENTQRVIEVDLSYLNISRIIKYDPIFIDYNRGDEIYSKEITDLHSFVDPETNQYIISGMSNCSVSLTNRMLTIFNSFFTLETGIDSHNTAFDKTRVIIDYIKI